MASGIVAGWRALAKSFYHIGIGKVGRPFAAIETVSSDYSATTDTIDTVLSGDLRQQCRAKYETDFQAVAIARVRAWNVAAPRARPSGGGECSAVFVAGVPGQSATIPRPPGLQREPAGPGDSPCRAAGDRSPFAHQSGHGVVSVECRGPWSSPLRANSVELAAARLQHANVLWLPNFNAGFDYYRHDGADQTTQGQQITVSKSAFAAGGGATLDFGVTDAIFLPLAARQALSARQFDLEAARNDALATVPRRTSTCKRPAAAWPATSTRRPRRKTWKDRSKGWLGAWCPRSKWIASLPCCWTWSRKLPASRGLANQQARLNRVLRLHPAAVVVPLEPPQLQVTLVPPGQVVDDLIPVGLLSRPELASRRPWCRRRWNCCGGNGFVRCFPAWFQGGSGPGGAFTGGAFGGGPNDRSVPGQPLRCRRSVVWTLDNLGAGNRAVIGRGPPSNSEQCWNCSIRRTASPRT